MTDERRQSVLTDADLEKIRQVTCNCPHGLTPEDIYDMKHFMSWWKRVQLTVGNWAIKIFLGAVMLVVAAAAMSERLFGGK